jgi:hypothetical protein
LWSDSHEPGLPEHLFNRSTKFDLYSPPVK